MTAEQKKRFLQSPVQYPGQIRTEYLYNQDHEMYPDDFPCSPVKTPAAILHNVYKAVRHIFVIKWEDAKLSHLKTWVSGDKVKACVNMHDFIKESP